jgi:hypothetical protein
VLARVAGDGDFGLDVDAGDCFGPEFDWAKKTGAFRRPFRFRLRDDAQADQQ